MEALAGEPGTAAVSVLLEKGVLTVTLATDGAGEAVTTAAEMVEAIIQAEDIDISACLDGGTGRY